MKDVLRNEVLLIRNSLSDEYVTTNSAVIVNKLKTIIDSNNYKNILIYMSMNNEVDVSELINLGYNIYITKTISATELVITKYEENLLIKHKFGYLQSSSNEYFDENIIDLVVVPGVVFDESGNRIGFGKGYYDRLLIKCSNAEKIGVCYDFQIKKSIPTQTHDVRMDRIVSN